MDRAWPWVCCLLLLTFSLCGNVCSRQCDPNHFWDVEGQACQPCSHCPRNKIIRKPCSKAKDTICGPFREFSFFNQLEDTDSSFPSVKYDGDNVSGTDKGGRTFSTKNTGLANEPMIEKDDGEYWKNLAFALIGVVCVLIFVATVVVLLACRKLHENSTFKRPEEEEDDDSGYVVIRAIRPGRSTAHCVMQRSLSSDFRPSPTATALLSPNQPQDHHLTSSSGQPPYDLLVKGVYRPKRTLLNYDADDVFESEDSAGSKTSRKFPLHPIPKTVTDTENQGHRVLKV